MVAACHGRASLAPLDQDGAETAIQEQPFEALAKADPAGVEVEEDAADVVAGAELVVVQSRIRNRCKRKKARTISSG